QAGLHRESASDRLHWILLPGVSRAEYSQHGIADVFFGDAAMRANNFIEPSPNCAHELPHVLQITLMSKGGEPCKVGEKGSDLFPLQGCCSTSGRGFGSRNTLGCSTFRTEPRADRHFGRAMRAATSQSSAATHAKARVDRIINTTTGTTHR